VKKKLEEFKEKAKNTTDEKEEEKYKMFIHNVEYFI
jgi:hypothetical protein